MHCLDRQGKFLELKVGDESLQNSARVYRDWTCLTHGVVADRCIA